MSREPGPAWEVSVIAAGSGIYVGYEQAARQAVPIRAARGEHRLGVPHGDAVQILHDQHPAGRPLPVHRWDLDPGRASDRGDVAGLDA